MGVTVSGMARKVQSWARPQLAERGASMFLKFARNVVGRGTVFLVGRRPEFFYHVYPLIVK